MMWTLGLRALKWVGIGATAGGLFVGAKQGAQEMFKWLAVGSALWMLYQFASTRRGRG